MDKTKNLDFGELVMIVISAAFIALMLIALGGIIISHVQYRKNCLALGDNYIYIEGKPKLSSCYRVVDGQLHYVDVHMEYAIREYEKRQAKE